MGHQVDELYADDREIESLVERFASFDLQPTEVTHPKHVAMTAWCFLKLPPREAAVRIHSDLQRYVEHYSIRIYNETITLFWTKLIGDFVSDADATKPAFQVVNEAVSRFGDSRLIFEYYTCERLRSAEARRQWVEPDLRSLHS